MNDKTKYITRSLVSLKEAEVLKGRLFEFDSVAEMIKTRATESPEKVHVLYYDQVITYSETNERANRVANFLKEKGVKKGDVVSLMVLNSPEVYYTMFGAQKLGAIAGTINFMLKGPEIAYILDDCRPKVVFVSGEFMKDFAIGYGLAEHKPFVVEVSTGIDHDENIVQEKLANILTHYHSDEALVSQNLDDPFLLLYSSGTTGRPKGVILSNRAQMAACKTMVKMDLWRPGDIFMILLPMFHVNPICCYSFPLTYMGLTICIRKGFSPLEFWPSITRYGVTVLCAVPAMLTYVLNRIESSAVDQSEVKLKYIFGGASPLPAEVAETFKNVYGVRSIIDGYGLTECPFATNTFNIPEKKNSIGTAFPDYEVEIMDDNNNILPAGEKGEICIKGDGIMLGYLNRFQATSQTIKNGWLHTGDMGYMDEEGYFYIVGRKQELINRGGENIYPREIEVLLEGHPKVSQVAVFGVPDNFLGEIVAACIIPKESESMTADEVKRYLFERIAKYKVPEIITFMSEFPLNSTGKIAKTELKKILAERKV